MKNKLITLVLILVLFASGMNIQIVQGKEKCGTVTGTVTYYYNDYRGDVSDTGAVVLLIPKFEKKKLSSRDIPYKKSNPKKYYYFRKVNGNGTYKINRVKSGKYVAIIISNNSNSLKWLYHEKATKNRIKSVLKKYVDASGINEIIDNITLTV